MLFMREMQLHY